MSLLDPFDKSLNGGKKDWVLLVTKAGIFKKKLIYVQGVKRVVF